MIASEPKFFSKNVKNLPDCVGTKANYCDKIRYRPQPRAKMDLKGSGLYDKFNEKEFFT